MGTKPDLIVRVYFRSRADDLLAVQSIALPHARAEQILSRLRDAPTESWPADHASPTPRDGARLLRHRFWSEVNPNPE